MIALWQPNETLAGKQKAEQVNVLTKTLKGIEFYKQLTTIVTEFHCFPSYLNDPFSPILFICSGKVSSGCWSEDGQRLIVGIGSILLVII